MKEFFVFYPKFFLAGTVLRFGIAQVGVLIPSIL